MKFKFGQRASYLPDDFKKGEEVIVTMQLLTEFGDGRDAILVTHEGGAEELVAPSQLRPLAKKQKASRRSGRQRLTGYSAKLKKVDSSPLRQHCTGRCNMKKKSTKQKQAAKVAGVLRPTQAEVDRAIDVLARNEAISTYEDLLGNRPRREASTEAINSGFRKYAWKMRKTLKGGM
jgi:hypothetical protein